MFEYDDLRSGVYEHYKSTPDNRKLYQVLHIGRHTETDEIVVVYIPLYHDSSQTGPRVQVRPASMFCDQVEYEGQSVKRFQWRGADGKLGEEIWKLEGYDSFDNTSYTLPGTYASEQDARRAAQERLARLETSQPSETTGGQDTGGIQDQVFIIRPNGTKYRFSG